MEKGKFMPDGQHIGVAKVGEKGQIVIPKEVRDMFGILPGDTLLVLADVSRGIAIVKSDAIAPVADAAFGAPPPASEEESEE